MDGVDYLDGSSRLLRIEVILFTVFDVWPVGRNASKGDAVNVWSSCC